VTASEFAFLALGLVLGVASGAALVEVLRARPPAAREVKVTVSPNSIHARRASTLSDPAFSTSASVVARGGPADRRWVDRDLAAADGPSPPADRTSVPSGQPGILATDPAASPSRLAPAGAGGRPGMLAIQMGREVDPMLAALRSTAGSGPNAAVRTSSIGETVSPTGPVRGGAAVTIADRPLGDERGAARGEAEAAGRVGATETPGEGASAGASSPIRDGPCAEEHRVADERCAVAARARDRAAQAADGLRQAQRSYDDHVSRAEAEAAATDPRSVRIAKEAAQHAFRVERSGAHDLDAVEAAARTWLTEINRINHDTREAAARLERHRSAATAAAPMLERLSVEADAARINAESADEACTVAREAVAACDEARSLAAGAEAVAAPARERAPTGVGLLDEADEDVWPMASRAGADAALLRVLRGERESMQRLVARLGADDPAARQRWQAALTELVEALIARAIEASSLDFPTDHFFWGPFTRSQNRDIASALSSLGYHYDGFGAWADDHAPTQRDLSLAVGYAGLDPMRIRHWPSEAEMTDLMREVTVAADEYVAGAAGGLSLGEMLTLLGRRADALTDLWNEWGLVRPLLVEAV
jgi:hypothetical protein